MIKLESVSEYTRFIDNMRIDLMEATNACFDKETDPEVSWQVFRDYLKKVKKRHKEAYDAYLEADDEQDLPESPISKWRRENPGK